MYTRTYYYELVLLCAYYLSTMHTTTSPVVYRTFLSLRAAYARCPKLSTVDRGQWTDNYASCYVIDLIHKFDRFVGPWY